MSITRSRGGWMVSERIPPTREGKRIRKWVPTLLEAAKLVGEIGSADPPAATATDLGPTLKAFSVEFLRRHEPARRDPRTYGSNVKILLEHFGETVRLREITVPMILDFRIVRIERDKVKDYSVNRQVACLSAIYSCAAKWGVWKGPNPCREIESYKEPPARDRVFSAEEVGRILSAAAEDPIFCAMVMTALYTGIRKGALLTLQWSDLRDGFVVVRHGEDKGGRSHVVPIPPALQAVLDDVERNGLYVFQRDGAPLTSDGVDTCWSRVRKKAKIDGGRFHDLRRTYGTAAMERGIGTGMIQRLLSHRQASTTERYLHTSRGALKDLAPLLGPPRKK